MVSKSPLRNPLEMFWKPKESLNYGKVCKNEEKMETFTNIAPRMTVDPIILYRVDIQLLKRKIYQWSKLNLHS